MIESVAVAIAEAVAQSSAKHLINLIKESENPEEAWEEGTRQCVKQAQISFRQYLKDAEVPNEDRLKRDIGSIGRSARTLAVEGEMEGHDDELTELIGEFASACSEYSEASAWSDSEFEDKFESKLNELGPKIRDKTD